MTIHYYALLKSEDEGYYVAMYVGKGMDYVDEDTLLHRVKLLGISLWNGKIPRIITDAELEEMEMRGEKVIVLYPEET